MPAVCENTRRRIVEAAIAVDTAKRQPNHRGLNGARKRLRANVLAATDSGVSWQEIGEMLGMCRGAAYKRFRRIPMVRRTPRAEAHLEPPLNAGG